MFSKRIQIKWVALGTFVLFLIYKKKGRIKKIIKKYFKRIRILFRNVFCNKVNSHYNPLEMYSNIKIQNQFNDIEKSFEKFNVQLESIETAISNLKNIK